MGLECEKRNLYQTVVKYARLYLLPFSMRDIKLDNLPDFVRRKLHVETVISRIPTTLPLYANSGCELHTFSCRIMFLYLSDFVIFYTESGKSQKVIELISHLFEIQTTFSTP